MSVYIRNSIISFFILCLWSFIPQNIFSQQYTTEVKGIIKDSITGEPLPFISVYLYKTTTGTISNLQGEFDLISNSKENRLIISSVGYKERQIIIPLHIKSHFEILLTPTTYVINEIQVRPQKERYEKKGNPGVALIEKVIANREEQNPKNNDYLEYERYQKMTFALNDFSQEQKKLWIFKKLQFIFDYIDTSEVSGKPILTLAVKEQIDKNYYRKNPKQEQRIINGIQRTGMDEMFNQESLQQFLDEIFKEVDPFENNISLLLTRFVSPISTIAPSYYKYYLLDTVTIGKERFVDLGFIPHSKESLGFVGHLYIAVDGSYFVKKIKLHVPKEINLNYVESLMIEQEYDRDNKGHRIITKDDMVVEFCIIPGTQGMYARRTNTYRNYQYSPPQNPQIFATTIPVITENDAALKPDIFWEEMRHQPIKEKENAIDKLLAQLREVKAFYYTEKVISILISGYIHTKKEDSKVDLGPMNTTISYNNVEGVRLRAGGITTANLNPNLFARAYIAYGTLDNVWKYNGELEYSFNKKKYHSREFPVHAIMLSHTYDLNQLGQHYLYTNKDNMFMSLKRMSDYMVTYMRKSDLSYKKEFHSGFSWDLGVHNNIEYPTRWVPFILNGTTPQSQLMTTSASLTLRYSPGEKYYQTTTSRYPIDQSIPVFTLSHQYAQKGILGSNYTLNRTDAGIKKRFWLSPAGYINVYLKAGKIWDKVPFPLLIIPNANLTYSIQYESYSLLNPIEFVNDSYLSWDIAYCMNGLMFNRIPFIKYLQWKEIFSFKGFYGSLSAKNDPTKSEGLYSLLPRTYRMKEDTPYMEVSVGIDNIFTIMRIDYVWRLTYRDHPNIDRSGVRLALKFSF